ASLKTQESFKSLQKTLYTGLQILSGEGKAPAKAPDARPEMIVLREPGATWGNYLQHQKASNHSMHNLYNLQRDLLTVASTVLGKQDPFLTSMSNQMELAKVKPDLQATKEEEASSKELKNKLTQLMEALTQQQ
ncbi:inositol phosphate phosphatase SopB, partial [Salmonella enterica]|uniref:inositol phosphate phosphatase SopB n=1 Tax=Salmonella enterica TaxID=28901 RepID=UPI00398C5AFD